MRLSDEEIIATFTGRTRDENQGSKKEAIDQSAETRKRIAAWRAVTDATARASDSISERRSRTVKKVMQRLKTEAPVPKVSRWLSIWPMKQAETIGAVCCGLVLLAISSIIGIQNLNGPLDDNAVTQSANNSVYVVLPGAPFPSHVEKPIFGTLEEAVASVIHGGEIQILGSATAETPRFEKPVTLRAVGQSVRIGSLSATVPTQYEEET